MARLFDMIETPEPGWKTRRIEQAALMLGEEAEWHVELQRLSDGATIHRHHPLLMIAWCRAVEEAHSMAIGLDAIEPAPEGKRASYNEPLQLDAEHQALADRVIEETAADEQQSYDKVTRTE